MLFNEKKTTEEIKQALTEVIGEMEENDLVQLHNDYCLDTNCCDDLITDYADPQQWWLDHYQDPYQAAMAVYNSKGISLNDNWIKFDGYENPYTFNDVIEEIALTEIVNWLTDDVDSLEAYLSDEDIEKLINNGIIEDDEEDSTDRQEYIDSLADYQSSYIY